MSEVSNLTIDNITYDIKDAASREQIQEINQIIGDLEDILEEVL